MLPWCFLPRGLGGKTVITAVAKARRKRRTERRRRRR
jgi:hypothetical protein